MELYNKHKTAKAAFSPLRVLGHAQIWGRHELVTKIGETLADGFGWA